MSTTISTSNPLHFTNASRAARNFRDEASRARKRVGDQARLFGLLEETMGPFSACFLGQTKRCMDDEFREARRPIATLERAFDLTRQGSPRKLRCPGNRPKAQNETSSNRCDEQSLRRPSISRPTEPGRRSRSYRIESLARKVYITLGVRGRHYFVVMRKALHPYYTPCQPAVDHLLRVKYRSGHAVFRLNTLVTFPFIKLNVESDAWPRFDFVPYRRLYDARSLGVELDFFDLRLEDSVDEQTLEHDDLTPRIRSGSVPSAQASRYGLVRKLSSTLSGNNL